MPSFDDLLAQTMPFHAAKAHGVVPVRITTDFEATASRPDDPFDPDNRLPGDTRSPDEVIEDNLIWQFGHARSTPARFDRLRVHARGMGMNYSMAATVMHHVEWGDLIAVHTNGARRSLPLTPEFVVGTWYVPASRMPGGGRGLWQLRANTDVSYVVAFAFQATQDGQIVPMDMATILAFGEDFMPDAGPHPDCPPVTVGADTTISVCLEYPRWVVFVSLTTCRERPDFAPGALVGFARFYPHLMIMSNSDVRRVEASLHLERPAQAMTHGHSEMGRAIKPLLVTDTNRNKGFIKHVPLFEERVVPTTNNIYDYYAVEPHIQFASRAARRLTPKAREALRAHLGPRMTPDEVELEIAEREDHPEQSAGEVTLADSRRSRSRVLPNCVRREGGAPESIIKVPRQGQFDSVHLAPRMRMKFPGPEPGTNVELDDIVMVFVCLHDCVHMHVRWAAWATEMPVTGFDGDKPFETPGAPAVPENQTVFASFPSPHSLVYRALAEGCEGGSWTVFCHHGAGYAIDEWPRDSSRLGRAAMRNAVEIVPTLNAIHSTMPRPSWPGFYWRCRWTSGPSGVLLERLTTPDIEDCIA